MKKNKPLGCYLNALFGLALLVITTSGCVDKERPESARVIIRKPEAKQEQVFKQVADYPVIKDSAQFISDLRRIFDLDVHESPAQASGNKITFFKKVRLNGSDQDYFLVEYDWCAGSMSQFPWKYQLLLTAEGKLVKVLSALRFDFVTIFPQQNPFLLAVIVTSRGNGGHHIYKVSADTLENVYEGYYDYDVRTFDGHEDMSVFEPNELILKYADFNKDGVNDLAFTGEILMLGKYTPDSSLWYDVESGKPFTVEEPASRAPVKYIFLYDKQTGHFKAKEDYIPDYKKNDRRSR